MSDLLDTVLVIAVGSTCGLVVYLAFDWYAGRGGD